MGKLLLSLAPFKNNDSLIENAINMSLKFNLDIHVVSILETENMNVYDYLNSQVVRKNFDSLQRYLKKIKNQIDSKGVNNVYLYSDEGDAGKLIVQKFIPIIKPDLLIMGKNKDKESMFSQFSKMIKNINIPMLIIPNNR